MKVLDRTCAGALFLLALAECWRVPRNYAGRIWILGTGLALLFTAMLNLLRLRSRCEVPELRLVCLSANVMMTVFAVALILSIGWLQAAANPQVLLMLGLLLAETIFLLAGIA